VSRNAFWHGDSDVYGYEIGHSFEYDRTGRQPVAEKILLQLLKMVGPPPQLDDMFGIRPEQKREFTMKDEEQVREWMEVGSSFLSHQVDERSHLLEGFMTEKRNLQDKEYPSFERTRYIIDEIERKCS
jgi:hypothetical protein